MKVLFKIPFTVYFLCWLNEEGAFCIGRKNWSNQLGYYYYQI